MKNCISMRAIRERDLATIWQIGFREEAPEWKNWDGPYFDDYEPYKSLAEFAEAQAQHFLRDDRYAIFLGDQLIGIVSRYWENEKTLWLEIGIVIFQAQYWSSGYGTEALRLWIDKTFADFPRLEHIGLTTWSGNERMMRAALKMGFQLEGQIRKVRYWQGQYYDSMKYGILREEWQARQN